MGGKVRGRLAVSLCTGILSALYALRQLKWILFDMTEDETSPHSNQDVTKEEEDCVLVWDLLKPISPTLARTLYHILGEDDPSSSSSSSSSKKPQTKSVLLKKVIDVIGARLEARGVSHRLRSAAHVVSDAQLLRIQNYRRGDVKGPKPAFHRKQVLRELEEHKEESLDDFAVVQGLCVRFEGAASCLERNGRLRVVAQGGKHSRSTADPSISNRDRLWFPFSLEEAKQGRFGPFTPSRTYFEDGELQWCLHSILHNIKTGTGRSLLSLLEHEQVVTVLPLHNLHNINNGKQPAVTKVILENVFKERQLLHTRDLIASYFGSEFGFYFAWANFYTWSLLALLPFAVIAVISSVWLPDGVLEQQEQHVSGMQLLLALGVSLWATVFLEMWKRRSQVLVQRWGMQHLVEEEKYFSNQRPEYYGDLRRSHITGKVEMAYPVYKRYLKYSVSFVCCVTALLIVVKLMFVCFHLEELAKEWAKHDFETISEQYRWIAPLLPSLFYAASIPVSNVIYTAMANLLTQWENHRTESDFTSSLIVKIISFQMVNCYLALFYLAFWAQDMTRLTTYMRTVFITTQFVGNVVEGFVPWMATKLNIGSSMYTQSRHSESIYEKKILSSVLLKEKEEEDDDDEEEEEGKKSGLEDYEKQWKLSEASRAFDEYLELVIQFGYVALFGWCWPPAIIFALLNNVVEVRLDAHKLCVSCRRPVLRNSHGIGRWLDVLEFISSMAVIANCAFFFVYLLQENGGKGFYVPAGWFQVHSDNQPRNWLISVEQLSTFQQFCALVVLEHLLFGLKWLVAVLIDDVPEAVSQLRAKEEFLIFSQASSRANTVRDIEKTTIEEAEEGKEEENDDVNASVLSLTDTFKHVSFEEW